MRQKKKLTTEFVELRLFAKGSIHMRKHNQKKEKEKRAGDYGRCHHLIVFRFSLLISVTHVTHLYRTQRSK